MGMPNSQGTPPLDGILETPVYVEDAERADRFYAGVLGLTRMSAGPRIQAYSAGPAQTLLVCRRGATDDDVVTEDGTVPGHRSVGPAHMAFRIPDDQFDTWLAYLRANDVAVYSTMRWPRGGRSVYFHDPDGNVLELATPGVWANY